MSENGLEATIRSFEGRMGLRRKMLRVTGVKLSQEDITEDQKGEVETSIRKCLNCKNEDACMSWLATVEAGVDLTPPPEFCPNRNLILRMNSPEM